MSDVTSDSTVHVRFEGPHPLGLPADRYSHHVKILGNGNFGKVYLCCHRYPPPPVPHPAPPSTPSDVRHMSIDLADPASGQGGDQPCPPSATAPNGTQPQDPASQAAYSPTHEWVAVKIFKPLVQCDLRSLEYLKREVVNIRRLQHPHVIGFRDVGITTDHRLYLTLEFADSGTLKHWLADRGGRLPVSTARWFAQQLVYGLSYCHDHGVYNRDIKPENLLLHSNLQSDQQQEQQLAAPLLKVADFGLCKSSSDSAPNSCVGSPHYMAPEVFTGTEYDGRKADVFSCGVVLYQMVFGALPFNRTPDGRKLDYGPHLKDILANMHQERWEQLLPGTIPAPPSSTAPTTPPAAAAGPAAGAAPPPPPVEPDPGLLDLLRGMLRYNPAVRLSLYDVMRHPWYREGLTEECYALLLSGSAGGADRPPQAGIQSVELIEAEFVRIIAHCTALQQQAEQQIEAELLAQASRTN